MKRFVPLACVLFSLSSCFGSSPSSASGGLVSFATRADKLTYEAVYTFGITGQNAGGVSTRLEIAQIPPSKLRKLETTTKPATGDQITIASWYVTNPSGHFACAQYGGATRCSPDTVEQSSFGDAQVDGFFDLPRNAHGLDLVRKSTRHIRIRGEVGTCFEGVPVVPSEPPVHSPQPTLPPQRFHYELCYSDDGVLLRGRRTNLAEVESGGPTQDYVLEAVSITRVVQPSDLRLPGPIVNPSDLKP